MSIAAAINQYLFHLQKNEYVSPLTIRNYRHYLNRFLSFCDTHSPSLFTISDISDTVFLRFHDYLNRLHEDDGLELKRLTKAYHLIALRGLFRFLKAKGYTSLSYRVIRLPQMDRQKMAVIDVSTVERLKVQPHIATPQGLRDKAILELLASCGMSVSELVRLDRDDIDVFKKSITIGRNTRRARFLPVPEGVLDWLKRYIVTRKDAYRTLFIRYGGRKVDAANVPEEIRLTARSVQRMVKVYAKAAGITQTVTPQTLRHVYATQLIKRGAAEDTVMDLLGFETRASVKQYNHFRQQ